MRDASRLVEGAGHIKRQAVIDRIGSFGTITTSLVLSIPIPAAERVGLVLGGK
ncbi:hypothetical protein [Ralstonia solanacearum]|uniref:hypothetical protein n=1 Tax=Ralstonia solanacearum TaxID=305 RepID=UPI000A467086|nr:hypothetical protein [Ralstonia solanacearum]